MSFGLQREGLRGEEDARPGSPIARGYRELTGAPGPVSGIPIWRCADNSGLGGSFAGVCAALPPLEGPRAGAGRAGSELQTLIVTHLLRRTALAKPPQTCCPQHFRQNNGAGAGNAASRLQSLPLRALLSPSAASGPGNRLAGLLA